MIRFYKPIFQIAIFLLLGTALMAQAPKRPTSADLHDAIKKLNVVGTALYLAAHPDDENTRMISWLANHRKVNTGYLSLTRGDGGQNRIGTEIRELLGVIRTQELLQARRVDGGQQLFSRANDFGYSKHPDETLKIWNEKEVMSDVIWAIRKFRPDIIINRFDHKSAGRTHGHHTSSAVLSFRTFEMAGDPNVFPEQLKYVDVWQPKRLYFNTSWWFYGSREKFAKADKSKMLGVDVGTYYPLLGKSNNEIAAESRSMHRCQGMGSTPSRGSQTEYLELLKGEMPTDKEDPFQGIDISWNRLEGGAKIGALIKEIEKEFKYDDPAKSVAKLTAAYQLIQKLKDPYWKEIKSKEIEAVIQGCLGLFLEAIADDYSATPGEDIELSMEMINRTGDQVFLKSIEYLPMNADTTMDLQMDKNQVYKFSKKINLSSDLSYTNPYWLNESADLGMYTVKDQAQRGQPETPRFLKVRFNLQINDVPMEFVRDMVYKKTDPVKGEVYRPFELTPPVFTNIAEKVYVFTDKAKTVDIVIKAGKKNVKGTLQLCHPNTWKVEPAMIDFNMALKGEEQVFSFTVTPPIGQEEGMVIPIANVNGVDYTKGLELIAYDHIPTQMVFQDAEARVVKIDLKKEGEKVGYIMGAGDEIPVSLEQIGYEVDLLEDKDIRLANLKKYDAIILGIRAYNTNDRLKFHQSKLMEYVEQGGTMIVQYNTSHRLVTKDLAPYPMKLSRDRVTVEEAEVRFLKPKHHILNYPNKITSKDFEGWVQERGLYFPNEWDDRFDAILSSNDPGEPARDGGLLVAKHGEGYYIYSGYSWFRELPAGVPGAYRLFTNLISIGIQP